MPRPRERTRARPPGPLRFPRKYRIWERRHLFDAPSVLSWEVPCFPSCSPHWCIVRCEIQHASLLGFRSFVSPNVHGTLERLVRAGLAWKPIFLDGFHRRNRLRVRSRLARAALRENARLRKESARQSMATARSTIDRIDGLHRI